MLPSKIVFTKAPFLLSLALLFSSCATIPQIPISTTFEGKLLETYVDSPLARDALLQPEQPSAEPTPLQKAVADADEHTLQWQYFRDLAAEYSVDYASLILYSTLTTRNLSDPLYQLYQQQLHSPQILSEKLRDKYLFLFVPGWGYASTPESGADMAEPRRLLGERGLDTELLLIDERGVIDENAALVAAAIAERTERPIILVSASSGGPSTAQAIGQLLPPEKLQHVRAWINVGGILQGSPLADKNLRWPRSWFSRFLIASKGWRYAMLQSMSTKVRRPIFANLRFPDHLQVVNFIGIPLSGQLTERAAKNYRTLRRLGPNDGLTLVTDALTPRGLTVPQFGLDHYFRSDAIPRKTVAAAEAMVLFLETK